MPTGPRLKEGFPITISFASSPTFKLWEVRVKPPGMDSGGPNDTTTMRNTRLRTRQPKKLVTMTSMTGTGQYNPDIYTQAFDVLGENQVVTVTFSDGSALHFYGWLDKFEPQEVVEGAAPLATFTIECSNEDANGDEVELTVIGPPS